MTLYQLILFGEFSSRHQAKLLELILHTEEMTRSTCPELQIQAIQVEDSSLTITTNSLHLLELISLRLCEIFNGELAEVPNNDYFIKRSFTWFR